MRSRAAAAILQGAGFTKVASMAGGIRAWNGLIAAGPPEAGMARFPATAAAEELAALAWYLEAGSRTFYAGLAALTTDADSRGLFELLGGAEERHQRTIVELYRELGGDGDAVAFPQSVLAQHPADAVMEGGVQVDEALSWARGGRTAEELLEYTMALETNSWDLYLRMRQAVSGAAARRVFEVLAEQEKHHLDMLTDRLGQSPGRSPRTAAGGAPR